MIAIHVRKGSFSDRWLRYCEARNLPYMRVNLFESDILARLREAGVAQVLFHVGTADHRTELVLKPLVRMLEADGIDVFPGSRSYAHYDDKVKQKYLFEQLNLPHAPMHAFYDLDSALRWIRREASYPFVFKLRRGAGSRNVQLVRDSTAAEKLARRMFGKGMTPVPSLMGDLDVKRTRHARRRDWLATALRFPRTVAKHLRTRRRLPREKGYFLAQEYQPENRHDTRITVVGQRYAFGYRRHVRPNDFRASGSGSIDYDPTGIDPETVRIAFEAARKIGGRSLAFDFVENLRGEPVILEVSYCYVSKYVRETGGYWTPDLEHHREPRWPEDLIIESLLRAENRPAVAGPS